MSDATSGSEETGTCFVIMGFGKKTDFETGRVLDLDKSYQNLIKPAVEAAGLKCIRADEIVHSGMIDVPMYEQLLSADVVVADLSTSNKNALYELGIRHALRPSTTVVIAEDGIKVFPFDLNHVVVRQYRHLGEDIGYTEAVRFGKQLTEAIRTVLANNPRAPDSPVYTFLDGLTPPSRAAAVQKAVQEMVDGAAALESASARPEAAAALSGSAPDLTHRALMQQVDEAESRKDFVAAKTLLASIRSLRSAQDARAPEDPYILQRLALLTYKSKHPNELQALLDARELLRLLKPETSNDPETLGLWQAVHKRLWGVTNDYRHLDEAVRAAERGFYLRNDYYNGINLAFLLNERAATGGPAEAIADFVQAQRVRREVLKICERWLVENPASADEGMPEVAASQNRESRYWVLATRAEAAIGLANPEGEVYLEEALAKAPKGWMKDSTTEQVGKLRALLADSPLKYVRDDLA